MKKYVIFIVIMAIVSTPLVSLAQMGTNSAQAQNLNTTLQDIYASQNITNQGQIDCSKVADDQFEKVGDGYMDVMMPNEQQHEVMDNMMGGEGSTSLTQAHINMGRSYLGCWSNYNSGPFYMPMMGAYGMMNYRGYGMMGNYFGIGWGWFSWILCLIILTLAIVGIVAIIIWIARVASGKKNNN